MKKRSPLTETERERAKVLHAGGKTPHAIAQSMGRSHHTLAKFLRKPETQKEVGVQREVLAGMFDSVAYRAVVGVSDTDIEKANLVQKMTSAGIAVDKAAILRGEMPIGIDVSALLEVAEAITSSPLPARFGLRCKPGLTGQATASEGYSAPNACHSLMRAGRESRKNGA